MTLLNYASLLTDGNVKAFIRLIRSGESWNDDANPGSEYDERAFRVRYGGWDPVARRHLPPKLFDSFDDHPRVLEPTPTGEKSSAAGAPQITMSTWDDMRARYPGFGPRFTPWDQMACAVAIIYHEGALDDVLQGRVQEAIRKCGNRWASLPGSTLDDGGGKLALEKALATWRRWGGHEPVVVAETITQASAPIEDRSTQARAEDIERIAAEAHHIAAEAPQEETAMAPLLPILGMLFSAFAPVLQAKLTKVLDKSGTNPAMQPVAANLTSTIGNIVYSTLGMAPPPAGAPVGEQMVSLSTAVAAAKAKPEAIATIAAQVDSYLDQIAPMIDQIDRMERNAWAASEDSMDRAAARASPGPDDWMAKALVIGILITSGVLIALVSGVAITQIALLDSRTPTTEVWAALTGIIGTTLGILGTVYAFKFGSTRQSQTKDFAIAELSTRRKA